MIKNFREYVNEQYMESDAIGYDIGEYIYHVTPVRNVGNIKKYGFIPQDGISINGKKFEGRTYFATSQIAAYDLSVNFGSYKDDGAYAIFKVDSSCLTDEYETDPLFVHGIYVEYPIDKKYIVSVIDASDLFDRYDDNDIENLY